MSNDLMELVLLQHGWSSSQSQQTRPLRSVKLLDCLNNNIIMHVSWETLKIQMWGNVLTLDLFVYRFPGCALMAQHQLRTLLQIDYEMTWVHTGFIYYMPTPPLFPSLLFSHAIQHYCTNLFILYHSNNIDVNDLVAIIIIILFIHYYYYLHILVLFLPCILFSFLSHRPNSGPMHYWSMRDIKNLSIYVS